MKIHPHKERMNRVGAAAFSPFPETLPFHCVMGREGKAISLGLFYKDTIPSMMTPLLLSKNLPKTPLTGTVTLVVKILTYKYGVTKLLDHC